MRVRPRGPHGQPSSKRQRPGSFDSDDEGSLVRLTGALGALERTTAAARQQVAEEGHHGLWEALERPVRAAGAAQSAAAAAAAFARGHYARPDGMGDAGGG